MKIDGRNCCIDVVVMNELVENGVSGDDFGEMNHGTGVGVRKYWVVSLKCDSHYDPSSILGIDGMIGGVNGMCIRGSYFRDRNCGCGGGGGDDWCSVHLGCFAFCPLPLLCCPTDALLWEASRAAAARA